MHLRDFVRTLRADWVAVVSGSLSIAFGVWAALFSPASWALRKVLWISFAIGLVVAAYRIWVAEHERYLKEKGRNGRPDIHVRLEHVETQPEFPDKAYNSEKHFGLRVTLKVILGNNSKPTKITKLGVRGVFDEQSFEGQALSLARFYWETTRVSDNPFDNEKKLVGVALGSLDLQSKIPIEVGTFDAVVGWLRFWFPALPVRDGDFASGELELLVTDGTGDTRSFPIDPKIKAEGEVVWRTIKMY